MAFGPRVEKLKDVDQTRAQTQSLINLYGAQSESMLAGAEKTRYQTGELKRTEGLRTDIKKEELAGVTAQREQFEIMLNNIKANKPLYDAARRLGIAQAESDYDNVTHLMDWVKENPEKHTTWLTREYEQEMTKQKVEGIGLRDTTMYQIGSNILAAIDSGRMDVANQLYTHAGERYTELTGKNLYEDLGLKEGEITIEDRPLIEGHTNSAQYGSEWALQKLKGEQAIETARVTGESAAETELKIKDKELKIAERYQDIESKDLKNVQAASKAMTTAMAQIQASNYGAVEAADGGIKSNSPHYGQHTTVNSAMAEAFEDLYKQGNRLSASEVSRQFWSDWTFDEDATRPSKWMDDPMYVPRDEERRDAYMKGLDEFINTQRAAGDESDIEELIQNYLAQEMQGYKKGITQRFNRAIK